MSYMRDFTKSGYSKIVLRNDIYGVILQIRCGAYLRWLLVCNHSQIIEELPVLLVHLRLLDVHILIGEIFPIFGESDLAIGNVEVGVVPIEEAVSQEDLILILH